MCSVHPGRTTQIRWSLARRRSVVVALLEPSRVDDADPAAMADHEIADELVALRREIDRKEARFARLAYAGHRRGIGAADGSPSTQAWLRRHTGMREGDAKAAIETGSVSELLPM